MKILEASLLATSKNYFKYIQEIKSLKKNGINNIHYDVMDNIFVPNSAFNGEKIKSLIKKGFNISVHLMVIDLEKYLSKFLKYKISYLTFHCEVTSIEHSLKLLKIIKSKNIKAGVAIKPETNLNDYENLIKECDIITIMGVEPGFGGQKFLYSTINKLISLKKIINKNCLIQLDGGVNLEIIEKTKLYVDMFVSGSFLMKNKNKFEILSFLN